MTNVQAPPDYDDLRFAGDVVRFTDEHGSWEIRAETDDVSATEHINDADCWGKVSRYCYDYNRERDTARPDGFTGRARKIEVDRGYWQWWEPYDGPIGWQDTDGAWQSADWDSLPRDVQRREIDAITDLLRGGFVVVVARLRRTATVDGAEFHRDDFATLGAIDSLANGYGAEVARDLVAEILAEIADGAE